MQLPTTFNNVFCSEPIGNLFATLNKIPFHLRSQLPLESLFDRLGRREKIARFSMTNSHSRTLVFMEKSVLGTAYSNNYSFGQKPKPENAERFYLSLADYEDKRLGTACRMLQIAATYFPHEFTTFYVSFRKHFPVDYVDGKEIIFENSYHMFRNYIAMGGTRSFILLTETPLFDVNYAGASPKKTSDLFVEVANSLVEFI